MPLVSVVMPVRDAEPFIALTVSSVLDQTLADLELIVVDDGSTDSSIARARAVADSRVTFIEGERRGPGAARNLGVRHSSAPWIVFTDADDVSGPTRVSDQLLSLSDAADGLTAVGCSPRIIDADGNCLADTPYLLHPDAIAAAAYSFMPMCGPTLSIGRSEFERVGGYSEDDQLIGVEDYDLLCRIIQQGGRIANLSGFLYFYRQHQHSITRSLGPRMVEAALVVQERHWASLPPQFSFARIADSRADNPRLHASAFLQLAIGCFRRKQWLSASKIASSIMICNPRGVLSLMAENKSPSSYSA